MTGSAGRSSPARAAGRRSPDGASAGAVLYRPIVRGGRVIGYLWAASDTAGYLPRAGGGADGVRAYWMRWLRVAWEGGLTPAEAMASWNPRWEFPCGTPATGAANEIAGLRALRALAEGTATIDGYASETAVLVRHHPVVRDGVRLGHLWASIDDRAAGFRPAADVPADDPAIPAWRTRLTDSAAAGLTPTQALHALRDAPDNTTIGHLTDPLGQSPMSALHPT